MLSRLWQRWPNNIYICLRITVTDAAQNFIDKHSGNAATVNWRWNGAPFGVAHSASASALAIVNIYANINKWRVNTTTMWECDTAVPLCKCNELNRSREPKPTQKLSTSDDTCHAWGSYHDSGKSEAQRQRNCQTEVKWTLCVCLDKHLEKSTDWRANASEPSPVRLVMGNGQENIDICKRKVMAE